MATFKAIVDLSLAPEGKPASQTITSHTQGMKTADDPDYVRPAAVSSGSTVQVGGRTVSVTNYN